MTSQFPHYVGDDLAVVEHHHGRLRPIVGVQSFQVLRANRTHPEWADDYGWTYNHAPMLAYWQNRFWLEYLSNPRDEHGPPGQTLLTWSTDGATWAKPVVVFPQIQVPDGVYQGPPGVTLPPGSYSVMHQRMGFYVAPDGRLLVLGFYGISPDFHIMPNDGRGMGRVVREVYADGSFGPIYFLRYNRHADWHEGNTPYPFYTTAPDAGFVAACEALLADRLVTLQWWEEDRSEDGFYAIAGGKALSYYHAPDGRVVGLWKWSQVAVSENEGQSWTPMTHAPSLIMAGGKIWGQRTSDGRYALVYNPSPSGQHRWPLAVMTGEDGFAFDRLRVAVGDVSPRRYAGVYKDFGLNYVRGIVEGNGMPPDGGLWITYSMNKEDIWVSRISVPVVDQVEGAVHDDFDRYAPGPFVSNWNTFSPLWAPVRISSDEDGGWLELRDRDPVDYARAERVFAESGQVRVRCRLRLAPSPGAVLNMTLVDAHGSAPVRLRWREEGGEVVLDVRSAGKWRTAARYAHNQLLSIELMADTAAQSYRCTVDDVPVAAGARFATPAHGLCRFVLQTKPDPAVPTLESEVESQDDLDACDEPIAESVYQVKELEAAPV